MSPELNKLLTDHLNTRIKTLTAEQKRAIVSLRHPVFQYMGRFKAAAQRMGEEKTIEVVKVLEDLFNILDTYYQTHPEELKNRTEQAQTEEEIKRLLN